MTTLPNTPDHSLSLAEWDALPEDALLRHELVDGVVVVSPRASSRHQRIGNRLVRAFEDALLPVWGAVTDVEVVLRATGRPTVRAPDVVVVREELVDDRPRQDAADVLAVVEVLSPSSGHTDHVDKLPEYARAGIECYLLVEPGPPVVLKEFRLRGDVYERVAEHVGRVNLTLDGIDVVVDLAGMLGA